MIDDFIDDGVISAHELAMLLEANTKGIKLVDATFVMPGSAVDPKNNHRHKRIHNAVFFDIDEIADLDSDLPHMIPSPESFENAVSALSISNDDFVIVYDQSGIAMAAARAWWMFRLFGHDKVCVLDGGLPYWETQGLPLNTNTPVTPEPAIFKAAFRSELVKSREDILSLLEDDSAIILDARGADRFAGNVEEPRPGLRSGHIPGSHNMPFIDMLTSDGRLKTAEDLAVIIKQISLTENIVTSCGSGVTACVIALGLYRAGLKNASVYDGSWVEWGQEKYKTPVERLH